MVAGVVHQLTTRRPVGEAKVVVFFSPPICLYLLRAYCLVMSRPGIQVTRNLKMKGQCFDFLSEASLKTKVCLWFCQFTKKNIIAGITDCWEKTQLLHINIHYLRQLSKI